MLRKITIISTSPTPTQDNAKTPETMEYYVISLVFAPLILIFFHLLFHPPKPTSKLPPGPKPWPIVGHLHLLGNKPHKSVTKLSQLHGPLMYLKLGSITTVVISSPNIAKEMFLNHDLAFSSRKIPDAARTENHDKFSMAWLPVCPEWRHLRKVVAAQLFTNQRLVASQGLRQKKVGELIEFCRECCEKGIAIDIGKAAFTTTLNLLSNTFFSVDLCSYDSSHSRDLKDVVRHLMEIGAKPNVSDFFPLLKFLDLQGIRRKNKRHFRKMMEVFEEIIDERLRDSTDSKDDVLDTLLRLVEDKELTRDGVKHMLMDLFVAGTETTSNTLEWAMAELLRHPNKIASAQAELKQVVGKEPILESNISKLPYIEAIIKETWRLHPPAPFLVPHKAIEDVQLLEYYVPKNTQVWVNLWAIGHDPILWPNSESFEPERFMGHDIDIQSSDFMLIPFGAGRRTCPGKPLAYRMVHLMLATLVHSFNWRLPHGQNLKDLDMEEKFGISLQKVHSLVVVPYPK